MNTVSSQAFAAPEERLGVGTASNTLGSVSCEPLHRAPAEACILKQAHMALFQSLGRSSRLGRVPTGVQGQGT